MRTRGERSLVLLSVLIVFACLLLAGGSRLIGHAQPQETEAFARGAAAHAVLCSAASSAQEAEEIHARGQVHGWKKPAVAQATRQLISCVCSDANGNVLGGVSYLRTVYQAFSLSDGFA